MNDFLNVTFLIPYRKNNNIDREHNLLHNLRYLDSILHTEVVIVEQIKSNETSCKSLIINKFNNLNIRHFEYITDRECIHKTKLYNDGINHIHTPIIASCDVDVFIPLEQMIEAKNLLENGYDYCFPFSDKYVEISKNLVHERQNFLNTFDFKTYYNSLKIIQNNLPPKAVGMIRACPPGGIVFIKKNVYEYIGLENENFCGYGPEDVERKNRLEKLKMKTSVISGNLYHLEHSYEDNQKRITTPHNRELFNSINRMNEQEIQSYYNIK